MVQGLAEDPTPLPKCEKDDECSWQCDVPKAPGSKEMEPKELKTVGELLVLPAPVDGALIGCAPLRVSRLASRAPSRREGAQTDGFDKKRARRPRFALRS